MRYQSNREGLGTHPRSQHGFCLVDQGPLPLEIGNDDMFTKAFELLWNFHLEKKTTSLTVKLQ